MFTTSEGGVYKHQCDYCRVSFDKTRRQQTTWISHSLRYHGNTKRSFCSKQCQHDSVIVDITGKQFGRLTVVGRNISVPRSKVSWHCRCKCGKEIIVNASTLLRGTTRSCGCLRKEIHSRSGPANPLWKSGKYTDVNGYVNIKQSNGSMLKEHRVIMEKILGRKLYDNETVHHKNGVRSDNRPENLTLMVGAHPTGINIKDAVMWAREIINRYESMLATEPLFAEAKINVA